MPIMCNMEHFKDLVFNYRDVNSFGCEFPIGNLLDELYFNFSINARQSTVFVFGVKK